MRESRHLCTTATNTYPNKHSYSNRWSFFESCANYHANANQDGNSYYYTGIQT